MNKYAKYKVTTESRLEDNKDKATLFVPREDLELVINMALDNCMVITIDSGVKEVQK